MRYAIEVHYNKLKYSFIYKKTFVQNLAFRFTDIIIYIYIYTGC